jgi:hypothetical protein
MSLDVAAGSTYNPQRLTASIASLSDGSNKSNSGQHARAGTVVVPDAVSSLLRTEYLSSVIAQRALVSLQLLDF